MTDISTIELSCLDVSCTNIILFTVLVNVFSIMHLQWEYVYLYHRSLRDQSICQCCISQKTVLMLPSSDQRRTCMNSKASISLAVWLR